MGQTKNVSQPKSAAGMTRARFSINKPLHARGQNYGSQAYRRGAIIPTVDLVTVWPTSINPAGRQCLEKGGFDGQPTRPRRARAAPLVRDPVSLNLDGHLGGFQFGRHPLHSADAYAKVRPRSCAFRGRPSPAPHGLPPRRCRRSLVGLTASRSWCAAFGRGCRGPDPKAVVLYLRKEKFGGVPYGSPPSHDPPRPYGASGAR